MKRTKKTFALCCALALILQLFAGMTFVSAADSGDVRADADPAIPIYEDTSYSFAERAADLVARMTLSQKGSQMISSPAPAITAKSLGGGALNVPATKDLAQYYWWNEGLHGYNRIDNGASVRGGGAGPANATSYPQSLTVGSTWNPELYYQEALQVSDEIRERTSRNSLGNAIDLNFYSPTVNLQRDPRWGRNEESYSEDPYLTVKMGSQYVLGLEGKNQDGSMIDPDGYYRLHSTIKHYVANNSESNRLNGGATTSLDALRNYYLAPYRGIIKATDVSSVMTAYSSLNTEPCSYSSYLMDTILRQTYGLSGHITSDCDAVGTMSRLNYRNPRTGATLTNEERLAGALAHGEDLECNGGYSGTGNYNSYSSRMIDAKVQTDKGLFTENSMDISLHRLMTARISTGEFDDNLALTQAAMDRIAAQQAADSTSVYNQTPERLAILEQVNNEGVVMLQNKDNFLPLQIPASGEYKVVVVGAWQTNMYLGLYSANANTRTKQITIQQGIENAIKAKNPNATFTYITSDSVSESNREVIEAANVCVVVGGANNQYSAEDRDRSSIAMNNNQATMFNTVGQWNPNTIAVMEYCGPVETYTFSDNVKAILWSSFEGLRKVGFGNVITGAVNPSGKLTATWFHSTNDLPDKLNYDLYPSEGVDGRTYMFYKGDAVEYPFGYGLSFTTYEYSNLKIDKTSYDANDTVKVSFDVKNTGSVAGKEIAQLYIAQPGATAANRPIRRLEGFQKIELQPGQTKTVSLDVKIPDLAYYNEADDCYSVDTGAYQVQVGKDSASANLTKDFTVTGAMDVYPELLTVKANAVGDTEAGIEERLIYNKGDIINPQLTVCMNNEKLYGYIIKEQLSPIKKMQSTALPEGMTFTYESNRPSVVKVEGDQIKAAGPGVATVTVTGTLDGKTVTADFVAYVEVTTDVDAITVDGEPLAKFSPDKYKYSMTLENDKVIPVVAATSGNEDLEITVTQAAQLPGDAIVECKDPASGVSSVYTITFKVKPSSTSSETIDFTTEADADKYEIIGQSQAAVAEGTGLALVTTRNSIETAGGQNSGTQATTPEDLVQIPVSGDWTATLETVFETNGARNGYYQFFGFFAAADDDLGTTDLAGIRGGDGALQDFVRENGTITADTDLKSAPGFDTNGKTYFLRLQKEGTTYTCSRSDDGEDFTEMFVLADTGVEAQYLVIDAYTGMTAGYKFTLKNLDIEKVGGNDWYETDEIVPGGTYVIVADDSFALNDEDGLNAAEVTVEGGKITSEVTDGMIWTFDEAEGVNPASDGSALYLISNAEGLCLRRGSQNAPMSVAEYDAGSASYFTWSLIEREAEDGSFTLYVNGSSRYALSGTASGFSVSRVSSSSGNIRTAGSAVRLYTQSGSKPVTPEIASISVDGNEIEFDAKTYSYNFEAARDSTAAPVVSAVAGNKKTEIEIVQAEGPTGKATVTATAGTKSKTYTLCFNYAPVDDYFADGDMSDAWTIENPLESEYQIVKGEGLKLITQEEDIYQTGRNWHNAFTMPAMGNWQAVAKAFYPITAELQTYQQLAFVLWQDEDNYVRINCQQSSLTVEPGKETNATMATSAVFAGGTAAKADDGSATLYFQINKLGDTYTLGWSQDGATFTSVGSATVNYADPKLVLIAGQNTTNEKVWLNFEYVAITSKDGVDANSDFLTWARDNVAAYIAADIPSRTTRDIELSPAPHGYEVSVSSSNPDVIAADGTVTPAKETQTVELTVTVTEGDASSTAKATVKVPGTESGEPEVDWTALDKAIEDAEAIDASLYTEESFAALEAALAAAKAVPANAEQDAVDAAAAALNAAIAGLVEKPVDKTALDEAVAAAEAIDKTKYTDASVAALEAALAAAKAVQASEDADQAAVDAAAEALNAAVQALEKKPTPKNYVVVDSIEAGKTYVVVADDAYALNNTEVAGLAQYGTGSTTRGSTPVTIEDGKITSAVDDSMLWTFTDASGSLTAYDEQPVYFIQDATGKYLQRGSMSRGNSGLILAENLHATMRYNVWSAKAYEPAEITTQAVGEGTEFCLYVNSEREYGSDYAGRVQGTAAGFDIPSPLGQRDPADPFAFMNSENTSRIKFYAEAEAEGLGDIDFTKLEDAVKYEIVGQTDSAPVEGTGLALVSTMKGIEPAGTHWQEGYDMLQGDDANTPVDIVKVPVSGDWTATLDFTFDQGGSQGYYEFFGFYAMEGEDYQNLAGIRGADGDIQDFLRQDGTLSVAQMSATIDGAGLPAVAEHWFRIQKTGDTYVCSGSTDGTNFTEFFTIPSTGVEADCLIIDAYSGMATGYTYTLKSLTFEGGETPQPVVDYTALQAAIEAAEAVDKAKYTDESVAALEEALTAAKAALESDDQAVVDAAAAALNAAVEALVEKTEPVVDRTALNEAIAAAEAVDKTKYTDESVAALEEALAAAKAVPEDADQAAVDAAAAALNAAVEALVEKTEPVVDRTALNEAIAAAEAVDKTKYTDESVAALEEALAAAKAVPENADQAAVDAAAAALQAAIAGLKEKGGEIVDGEWVLADTIELGKPYVIVADGKYAMTNRQEGPALRTYAGNATTTLASAAVTVEGDKIVSEVTDDMQWTFSDYTGDAAYDGQAQYFIQDLTGGYLRRGSGSSGQGAQLLVEAQPYSTIRYNAWSFYPYEGQNAYAMYANSERAYGTDYPFYVFGGETSFDSPGHAQRDEADPFAFINESDCSKIQLYTKVEKTGGMGDIDFTKLEDADKYEIVGQTDSAPVEGIGLTLVSTMKAIETAGTHYEEGYDMLTGDDANTPVDIVKVPVAGDWTATLNFAFDPASSLGYYEFFGFYAMEGEDYQNLVGIRGADGDIQDFLRQNGNITAAVMSSDVNGAGLPDASEHWFRIQKTGDDYVCYGSTDGENYKEFFSFSGTGIDADYLIIDAYSSMQEGYTYTLKSLKFEGGETPPPPKVDKAALDKAVSDAEAIDKSKYTDDSVAALEKALEDAKKVQADPNATQAEVDAAAKAVTDAVSALVPKEQPPVVDKSKLEKAIEDAKAVDPKKYTEDTAKALADALEKAEAVQAKADATQAEVDAAEKALNDAIAALEPFLFDDVKDPAKFYFDPVYWAFYADPQITNGMDATHFGPDNACTRGHVVTFLWRAAGCPEPKSAQTPFKDLKKGAFYEKAVAWAVEQGITKGTSDTTFSPDASCTRGQIVTFLWRFKGEEEPKSTTTPFTDLKKGAFYEKAVSWAVENEVTNGMTATTFGPDATCTRGQVVTFLYRAMEGE